MSAEILTPDILKAGLSGLHIAIVAILVIVLFGRGKISEVMGEFGKGIKGFKKGLQDAAGEDDPAKPVERAADGGRIIDADPAKDKTRG